MVTWKLSDGSICGHRRNSGGYSGQSLTAAPVQHVCYYFCQHAFLAYVLWLKIGSTQDANHIFGEYGTNGRRSLSRRSFPFCDCHLPWRAKTCSEKLIQF